MSMLLFSFWLVLCTPFSSWKGGSVNLLLHVWFPSLVAFLGVNALLEHTRDVRRSLYTIGFASLTIVILSLFTEGTDTTRFDLGVGTLGNANDLAQMLLLGLPGVLLFLQSNKGRKHILRLLLLLGILLMLKVAASTASRAGVLTLLLYGIILFWSASGLGRLRIGAVVMVIGIVFFTTAPKATLLRYATILPFVSVDANDEKSEMIRESAEGSSAERRVLFQQSLELTLRNPLFGVGPGTFDSAAADVSKEKGVRALWHQAHNSYTQVSAECGIPGFLIYVSLIVATFRSVLRVRKQTAGKPALNDLRNLSLAILMTLACFALNAAFASLSYLTTFPMLAALADGFSRSARREIAAREDVPSVAPRTSLPANSRFHLGAKPA